MPELKRNFSAAKMNKDLDERLVPNGQYRDALNIQISTSDESNVGSAQTILGNTIKNTMAPVYGSSTTPIYSSILSNAKSVCVGSIAKPDTDKVYYLVAAGVDNVVGNSGATLDIQKDYIIEYDAITEKLKYVFVDIYQANETASANSSSSNAFLYVSDNSSTTINKTGIRIGMSVWSDQTAGWGSSNNIYTREDGITVKDIIYNSGNNSYKIFLQKDGADFTPASGVDSSDIIKFSAPRVLNFEYNRKITAINIIDDLLFWTDGVTEPKKINITRSIKGTGGEEYLVGGGVNGFASGSPTNVTFEGETDYFHTRLVVDEKKDGNYIVVTDAAIQKVVYVEEKHVSVIKKAPTQPLQLEMSRTENERVNSSGNANPSHAEYSTSAKWYDGGGDIYTSGTSLNISFSSGAWDVREGDKLVFTNDLTQSPTRFKDYQVRAVVTDSICNDPNNLAGDANNPITISILSISPSLQDTNEHWICRREEKDALFEFKFVRFSYRYKYEDGEYSPFAPFSQIAFIPDKFEYYPKKGHNLGMRNQLRELKLKQYFPEPGAMSEDVIEVDLLYKETNNPTVYTIKTIKPTDFDPVWPDLTQTQSSDRALRGEYEVTTDLVHAVLPSNQILRPWDNVPRKAVAQEVSANRLIYGNYTQNYTVPWDPFISVSLDSKDVDDTQYAETSVKSMRTYHVGVVFSDDYGRETPVLTNKAASLRVSKDVSSKRNRLKVKFTKDTVVPNWAKYYSWYIKEPTTEYYTMAMDRWYNAADGNIWISFPSSERNKVDIETFLNLKKAHGSGTAITDKARYKILAIENEAPDFIKTEQKSLGTIRNINDDKFGDTVTFRGFPLIAETEVWIEQNHFEALLGPNLLIETPDSFHLRIYGGTDEVSKKYEIVQQQLDTAAGFYKFKIKGRFEDDISFTSQNNTYGSRNSGLSIELISDEVENRPEFDGRFFVKIHKDNILETHILLGQGADGTFTSNSHKIGYLNNDYNGSVALGNSNMLDYNARQRGGDGGSPSPGGTGVGVSGLNHPTIYSHHGIYTWGLSYTAGTGSPNYNSSYGLADAWINGDSVNAINGDSGDAKIFWKELAKQHIFFIDACSAYSLTGRKGSSDKNFPGANYGTASAGLSYYNNFIQSGVNAGGYASDGNQVDRAGAAPGGEPSNLKADRGQVSRGIWESAHHGVIGEHSLMDISWTGMGYEHNGDKNDPYPLRLQEAASDSRTNSEPAFGVAIAFINELTQPGTRFRFENDPDIDQIYTVESFEGYFVGAGNHPQFNSPFDNTMTTEQTGAWGIRNFQTGGSDNQYYGHNLRQRWTLMVTPRIGSGPSGYNPCTGTIDNIPADNVRTALAHDCRTFERIMIIKDLPAGSRPYEETFTDNPAIWETEPKETVDLDIYYQASGLIPMELNEETNEEYIPVGATFNSFDDSTGLVAQEHTVESWNERIITFTPAIPANYSIIDLEKLTFTKRGNYILTAKADGAVSATATTVKIHGGFSTTSANHQLYTQTHILDWNNCWSVGNGVESDRIRDDFNAPQMDNGVKASSVLAEPIREEFREHGLIWSGIYNSQSGINDTNQFIQAEKITKDLNPVYGSIQKLYNRDTRLIMFCEDKVLRAVTNKDALYNADGKPQLVASNAVVGDVTPYQGDFGISTFPESFAATPGQLYFADPTRGQVLALEPNGIRSISNLGMKDYFADNLKKYIDTVQGTYDEKKHEYNVTIAQKYSYQQVAPDYVATVSYNEKSNGWSSFKSFYPESGVSINNQYYTFKDGEIYKHHDDTIITHTGQKGSSATKLDMSSVYGLSVGMVVSGTGVVKGTTISSISSLELTINNALESNFFSQELEFTAPRNNFYGGSTYAAAKQYESNITLVFNDKPEAVKSFNTINYEGTQAKVTAPSDADIDDAAGNTITSTALDHGEYFNLSNKQGWYVDSITTNKQTGSVIEFKDKECKWFGAVCGDSTISSGSAMNIDESEFSVQGLGNASFSFAGGGGGTPPVNPIVKLRFENNTSSSYVGIDGSGSAWDSSSVITTEEGHWRGTDTGLVSGAVLSNEISVPAGSTVSGGTVNLTITPFINQMSSQPGATHSGYDLSAGDFKIGNGTETSSGSGVWNTGAGAWNADTPITSVTFTDNGQGGQSNNTVNAAITYGSFTAPTSDTTYYIDIDEDTSPTLRSRAAGIRSHWVYNSNQTVTVSNIANITETSVQAGSSTTPGIYKFSGTVTDGVTTKIAEIRFVADSGYHYRLPSAGFLNLNKIGDYTPYYSYNIRPTYSSNKIASFYIDIYYTSPVPVALPGKSNRAGSNLYPDPVNFLDLNHIIDIQPDIIDTPAVISNTVTHMLYPTTIGQQAQSVPVRVFGVVSTKYTIQFTKQASTTSDSVASSKGYWNFTNGTWQDSSFTSTTQTIGEDGFIAHDILIPFSLTDVRYDILLASVSSSTIPSTLDGHGEASITQQGFKTVTLKTKTYNASNYGTIHVTGNTESTSIATSRPVNFSNTIWKNNTVIGGNNNITGTQITVRDSNKLKIGMVASLGNWQVKSDGTLQKSLYNIKISSIDDEKITLDSAVAIPDGSSITFFELSGSIIPFSFTIPPGKTVSQLSVEPGGDVGRQPNNFQLVPLTTAKGDIDGIEGDVTILTNGGTDGDGSESTTLVLDTTRGVVPGMVVTGTGVSGTVTVSSVNSITQVTLSSAQTIANDVSLKFTGNSGDLIAIEAVKKDGNMLVQGYLKIDQIDYTTDIHIRIDDFIETYFLTTS